MRKQLSGNEGMEQATESCGIFSIERKVENHILILLFISDNNQVFDPLIPQDIIIQLIVWPK